MNTYKGSYYYIRSVLNRKVLWGYESPLISLDTGWVFKEGLWEKHTIGVSSITISRHAKRGRGATYSEIQLESGAVIRRGNKMSKAPVGLCHGVHKVSHTRSIELLSCYLSMPMLLVVCILRYQSRFPYYYRRSP